MDVVNIGEWLRNVGTTNEPFCMASEGSFVSGELAYNKAQSVVDGIAPSEVQRNLQVRQGAPTIAHLEQSDHRIALELSKDVADRPLAGLIASDEV